MNHLVTRLSRLLVVALFVTTGLAGNALAQDPSPALGDDFIFFVNGTNVQVPMFAGVVAADPLNPDNQVMQYNYGDFSYQPFEFPDGVDVTANRDGGDVLSFDLLVDPANQGKPNLSIAFLDAEDGSGANDGSADLGFRLLWRIPEYMRNGEWHNITVPLPPATWQELEDAKAAGFADEDSLAQYWAYGGAWSTGGFPVALDGQGPNTAENPNLWSEFEWNRITRFGGFFDNNQGGGPMYVDNFYIGARGLDLTAASGAPAAMTGVTFATDGAENVVSWTHNPAFGGYNIYSSDAAITDVRADGVSLIGNVPFSADAFELRDRLEIPHPAFNAPTYYAVTSTSSFGVENPDVSSSAGVIDNPNVAVSPSVVQLTEDEGNALFDAISAGTASGAAFPPGTIPFRVDDTHSQQGEFLGFPDSNDDLSATVWMGYTDLNELWVYAEVKDDVNEFIGDGAPVGDAWQFDSVEILWGNYDVRDVGGTVPGGSPHQDMQRGDFADYQFRLFPQANSAGEVTNSVVFAGGGSLEDVIQGGGAAYEDLTDGSGNVIGWKMLGLIPLDQIQNTDAGDAVLDPPGADEVRLIPLNISLNDADGNTRETQIVWSLKGNVNNQWWNTPAQSQTVAMVGRNLAIFATSNETDDTVPGTYALDQNYPNPFNPATSINFTLANTEQVTLRVYDILGREVATLIDGQPMTSGRHSVSFDASQLASGVYLYRLEAGTAFAQTRQMLLLK